jgi:F-box-like
LLIHSIHQRINYQTVSQKCLLECMSAASAVSLKSPHHFPPLPHHRLLSTPVHLFLSMTILRARQRQSMYAMGQESSLPMEVNVRMSYLHMQRLLINADWCNVAYVGQVSIDILPDDILLDILHLYIESQSHSNPWIETWDSLVYVCRRWRNVVLESPRRLNLRLLYTIRSPASGWMSGWRHPVPRSYSLIPAHHGTWTTSFRYYDRSGILQLQCLPSSLMESVSEAMQGPFSELTKLELKLSTSDDIVDHRAPLAGVPASSSFLGGSGPRLRSLYFEGVPFPGLPKLLLSSLGPCRAHPFLHSSFRVLFT